VQAKGKVIAVTGAGSGIGRELALLLLTKGAKVAGVDVNAAALARTAALAGNRATEFAEFVTDITDRSAVEALPGQVIARFGTVDGIINNAGIIQPFLRLKDLDYGTIERVLNVNLLGTLFVTKAFFALPAATARGAHRQPVEHGRLCSRPRPDHLWGRQSRREAVVRRSWG